MSKIRILMRRAALVSVLAGALIVGSTATAYASVPAAPEPVATSSAGASNAAENDEPITTMGASDCTNHLENYGYTITNARRLACVAAAFAFPSAQVRITTCTAALIATRVGIVIAPIACTLATA